MKFVLMLVGMFSLSSNACVRELIEQHRQDEIESLQIHTQTFDRFYPLAFAIAYARLLNADNAHQVAERVLQNLSRWTDERNPDFTERLIAEVRDESTKNVNARDRFPDVSQFPVTVSLQKLQRAGRVLAHYAPKDREWLVLYYLQGKTMEWIAEQYKVPVLTVVEKFNQMRVRAATLVILYY